MAAARATAGSRGMIRTDLGRKSWMDLVKGVAIILVVVFHCMLFLEAIGFEGDGMTRGKLTFEAFPMPAFFLIAGMFGLRIPQWTFAETWRRRIAGYLYLYVLWSVIRFLFYLVVPNVRAEDGAGATASDPVALLLILVWPSSSYWFIYALAVFTAAAWAIRRMPPWAQVAVAGALASLVSSGILNAHNVGWNRMGAYFVFFLVGVLWSKRLEQAALESRGWHVAAAFGVFALVTASLAFAPMVRGIPGLVLVGQVAAVAFGVTAAVRLVRLRPLTWLSTVGVRSFEIYLLHVFVIAGLGAALAAFPVLLDLPGGGWIVLSAMTAAVIVLSVLLFRLLSNLPWLFVSPFRTRPSVRRGERGRPTGRRGGDLANAEEPTT